MDTITKTFYDVVHDVSNVAGVFADKSPDIYRKFTAEESYYYNTRLTYLPC